MRFILMRIARDDTAAAPGSMEVWRADLERAGVLLAHDELLPPSLGARVFVERGEAQVLAPPFKDVREVVHDTWLLEVGSLKEAIGWARRCPAEPGFVIEVRQLLEPGSPGKTRRVVAGFRSTIPPE